MNSRPPENALITCRGLVIGHRGRALLPPLDIALKRGQVLLVAGRNGAGKSTWLRTLLGLIPPVAGTLEQIQPSPKMSYVPQAAELDRLAMVRADRVAGWGRLRGWQFLRPWAVNDDRNASANALAEAGAADYAKLPFQELSGGQKQRVLFARMLAAEADIALLDEPTAAMDVPAQEAAYRRIATLAKQRLMAMVVVTHNLATALAYADEVLFLDRRDPIDDSLVITGSPAEISAHPGYMRAFGGRRTNALPTTGSAEPDTAHNQAAVVRVDEETDRTGPTQDIVRRPQSKMRRMPPPRPKPDPSKKSSGPPHE